jgi:hypothetical protein
VSLSATPIFLCAVHSKILPEVCLRSKKGVPLTDLEIVRLLISCLQQSIEDRLQLIGTVNAIEKHLLEKYGEIYQEDSDK